MSPGPARGEVLPRPATPRLAVSVLVRSVHVGRRPSATAEPAAGCHRPTDLEVRATADSNPSERSLSTQRSPTGTATPARPDLGSSVVRTGRSSGISRPVFVHEIARRSAAGSDRSNRVHESHLTLRARDVPSAGSKPACPGHEWRPMSAGGFAQRGTMPNPWILGGVAHPAGAVAALSGSPTKGLPPLRAHTPTG